MTVWFTRWWWAYLLADCTGWTNFWCRAGGHSAGPEWYHSDPNRLEPNMHCKNCGEDLG